MFRIATEKSMMPAGTVYPLGSIYIHSFHMSTYPVEPWFSFPFPIHVFPAEARVRHSSYARHAYAEVGEVQQPP